MRFLKFIFALFTFYFLLFTLPIPVHAQSVTAYSLPPTISPTSPIYTDLLVHNLFHTFSCLSVGSSVIGQPCLSYRITQNAQGTIKSVPTLSQVNLSSGAIGTSTSLIGALYAHPPVRTIDYLASVGQGLGIVKEAKAQVIGSGAQVLNPILTLWQVSRNIAYVFMIIIFVVIGLLVMFRQRINPQTVITAQTALPGLVIGLILITFSYFLAGLVSDMAFVGTNVVGYYFSTAGGVPSADQQKINEGLANKHNILSIFSTFTRVVDKDIISNAVKSIWGNFNDDAQRFLTGLATMVSFQLSSGTLEAAKAIPKVGLGIQAAAIGAAGIWAARDPTAWAGLLFFVAAVAILLLSMFKLLLKLINNYLTIIFLTITAPFYFMAASLPGRQGIATAWVLNMLCNVLSFPAVLALFYFVAFLLSSGQVGVDLTKLPFQFTNTSGVTGPQIFPLFGGLDLNFLNLLLAFGALVASPSIPDIICRTIGRVGAAGGLIGQELSAGIAGGRGYAGQAQQGIGAAAGYGASGRGMFSTPGYKVGASGEIVETYEPGRGATFGAIARSQSWLARGIRKISGGRIGRIPPPESEGGTQRT